MDLPEQFGYAVHVAGHGFVEDLMAVSRAVWFVPDLENALMVKTFKDAQLLQCWVLSLGFRSVVGILPFSQKTLVRPMSWHNS